MCVRNRPANRKPRDGGWGRGGRAASPTRQRQHHFRQVRNRMRLAVERPDANPYRPGDGQQGSGERFSRLGPSAAWKRRAASKVWSQNEDQRRVQSSCWNLFPVRSPGSAAARPRADAGAGSRATAADRGTTWPYSGPSRSVAAAGTRNVHVPIPRCLRLTPFELPPLAAAS
jgi:hypothetical protein